MHELKLRAFTRLFVHLKETEGMSKNMKILSTVLVGTELEGA